MACAIRGTDDQDGMPPVDVWASIEPVDHDAPGRPPREFRMEWDGSDGKFHGAAPALPPGAYRLIASADEVPHAGALDNSQLVEVVDGDQVQ